MSVLIYLTLKNEYINLNLRQFEIHPIIFVLIGVTLKDEHNMNLRQFEIHPIVFVLIGVKSKPANKWKKSVRIYVK